jgi:hypothetical protein
MNDKHLLAIMAAIIHAGGNCVDANDAVQEAQAILLAIDEEPQAIPPRQPRALPMPVVPVPKTPYRRAAVQPSRPAVAEPDEDIPF